VGGRGIHDPEPGRHSPRARPAAGDRDPFSVRFWGVGNESWGCGGEFTAEEYATEYRRYAAWVPRYGVELALIGSGPGRQQGTKSGS